MCFHRNVRSDFHRNVRSEFQRNFKSQKKEGCFISWNCRGVSNKESSLIDLVNDKNPICVCLQETKLGENSKFHFSNYNFVHKNQTIGGNEKAKGGVGILIKPGVNYVEINLDTIFQAVAVQLNVFKKVTVCSIYIPPNPPVFRGQGAGHFGRDRHRASGPLHGAPPE